MEPFFKTIIVTYPFKKEKKKSPLNNRVSIKKNHETGLPKNNPEPFTKYTNNAIFLGYLANLGWKLSNILSIIYNVDYINFVLGSYGGVDYTGVRPACLVPELLFYLKTAHHVPV